MCELRRILEAGVSFGVVVAYAGYGIGAAVRQALSALGLLWAVGILCIQKVYPADVQLVAAPLTRGRPRETLIPDVKCSGCASFLNVHIVMNRFWVEDSLWP